ncbi:hypothetical protein [Halobaculum lipolyticum]|uniref:Uncharacterized protein n=1 Tax=Halobaculum lipolyticum TaxID=3032001 RepID=A0ABD5W9A5_9EURY|nr:hypothetical protein [Halobaculum sp. DT31]
MVLSYISHRHSVVDSRFEREEKLKTKLGAVGSVTCEGFTEDEYQLRVKVADVDVREPSGRIYRYKKLLLPTAEIGGNAVVKLDIHENTDIPLGSYVVKGFNDDDGVIQGTLTVSDEYVNTLILEVDSVDTYRVPPMLTNALSYSPNLRLDPDENEFMLVADRLVNEPDLQL